ncbi:MAG: hypothetical protein KJP00_14130 [Bacteroidia bacterium]|nr:hypothetical protein [Bacteroidia bacterium]
MTNFQDILSKILFDERYRWMGHLLFWLVMFADKLFALLGWTERTVEFEVAVYGMLMDMVIVYFNLYFLIPQFFKK